MRAKIWIAATWLLVLLAPSAAGGSVELTIDGGEQILTPSGEAEDTERRAVRVVVHCDGVVPSGGSSEVSILVNVSTRRVEAEPLVSEMDVPTDACLQDGFEGDTQLDILAKQGVPAFEPVTVSLRGVYGASGASIEGQTSTLVWPGYQPDLDVRESVWDGEVPVKQVSTIPIQVANPGNGPAHITFELGEAENIEGLLFSVPDPLLLPAPPSQHGVLAARTIDLAVYPHRLPDAPDEDVEITLVARSGFALDRSQGVAEQRVPITFEVVGEDPDTTANTQSGTMASATLGPSALGSLPVIVGLAALALTRADPGRDQR